MEYKAQLVIRSREREGVELINKIKELATDSNRTYSDMALELLTLAFAHQDAADSADSPAPGAPEDPTPASARGSKSKSTTTSTSKASTKPAPITPKAIAKVADKCVQQLLEEDLRGATKTLAGFFAKAGPIEGGRIKTALESTLEKENYDLLLKHLRKTQEYRAYRQRVILQR